MLAALQVASRNADQTVKGVAVLPADGPAQGQWFGNEDILGHLKAGEVYVGLPWNRRRGRSARTQVFSHVHYVNNPNL
jgi:hypothetical protein